MGVQGGSFSGSFCLFVCGVTLVSSHSSLSSFQTASRLCFLHFFYAAYAVTEFNRKIYLGVMSKYIGKVCNLCKGLLATQKHIEVFGFAKVLPTFYLTFKMPGNCQISETP